jgi:hypothetical protein
MTAPAHHNPHQTYIRESPESTLGKYAGMYVYDTELPSALNVCLVVRLNENKTVCKEQYSK